MNEIANILLEKRAVTLNTKEPYTYSSGIRSPIYCDNRSLAEFPKERKKIVNSFLDKLKNYDFDIVAGTSTAGIQWAAWIANELEKPMAYIRGNAKKHGKGKQIEGANVNGKKVAVIEDLISTGRSSFDSVTAVGENGGSVTGVFAIFTYNLKKAEKLFRESKCPVYTLCDFDSLIDAAAELNYLTEDEIEIARQWNKDPVSWGPNNGFENAK
ncbi:MAG: orotate phosphoribosyltransferase [Candidatus Nanoarchaeia archaeon]